MTVIMVTSSLLSWMVTAYYKLLEIITVSGDDDGYFTINTVDGCKGTIFTTAVPSDRERYPTINLTILASDRSSSPNTVSTSIQY